MADGKSSLSRKNLVGSINAYLRAFPHGGRSSLTVKLQNVENQLTEIKSAISQASDRQDVTIVTDKLDDEGALALIRFSDVVISMHRAEGFGLHLAEAMALGKVVVATNWSGNTDFMNAENSICVPSKQTRLEDSDGIYSALKDAEWADPDISQAAKALRVLADDPELYNRLGKRAASDIADHCNAKTYAEALRMSQKT